MYAVSAYTKHGNQHVPGTYHSYQILFEYFKTAWVHINLFALMSNMIISNQRHSIVPL